MVVDAIVDLIVDFMLTFIEIRQGRNLGIMSWGSEKQEEWDTRGQEKGNRKRTGKRKYGQKKHGQKKGIMRGMRGM